MPRTTKLRQPKTCSQRRTCHQTPTEARETTVNGSEQTPHPTQNTANRETGRQEKNAKESSVTIQNGDKKDDRKKARTKRERANNQSTAKYEGTQENEEIMKTLRHTASGRNLDFQGRSRTHNSPNTKGDKNNILKNKRRQKREKVLYDRGQPERNR